MKVLLVLLVSVACFGAVPQAKAETLNIEDSYYAYIDKAYDIMINFYYNSDYENYIITSERIYYRDNSYYSKYYICLTSDNLDKVDSLNITSNCDEIYTYNTSNNSIQKTSGSLTIDNSIYYSSHYLTVSNKKSILFLVFLIITCIVGLIICAAIDKIFKSRNGGFKYEEI